MASYSNPVFYSEAADSAVQPDVQASQRTRRDKSRARSRSPLSRLVGAEQEVGATEAETKSPEVYEQWRTKCRDLFWQVLGNLIKRPVREEEERSTSSALGKIVLEFCGHFE